MDQKYRLLCPLCSYETEHIVLTQTYNHTQLRKRWFVCLDCRHLQEKPQTKKIILHAWRVLWMHLKQIVLRQRLSKKTILPKLFQKPTCKQCQGEHLLEWDGHCPYCGSAFLKKSVA